jgi:hypothetical protein
MPSRPRVAWAPLNGHARAGAGAILFVLVGALGGALALVADHTWAVIVVAAGLMSALVGLVLVVRRAERDAAWGEFEREFREYVDQSPGARH